MTSSRNRPRFDGPGILIGETIEEATREKLPFGFCPGPSLIEGAATGPSYLIDESEAHGIVVGPTGTGKSRFFLIPNLLRCLSSVIVTDIKGELALTTARYRRSTLHHQVAIFDPFRIASDGKDGFNIIDYLLLFPGYEFELALLIAEMLASERSLREPFWDLLAIDLNAVLIALAATDPDPAKRNMVTVWDMLSTHDVTCRLSVLLDTRPKLPPFIAKGIAGFLEHEGEKVRTSVVSTARQHMRIFSSPAVQRVSTRTTFDLRQFMAGERTSIYCVLPAQKVASHSALMRLWLTALMGILTERTAIPRNSTVCFIDELANIGNVPILLSAFSLLRGFGVRCIVTVQSVNQLATLWPTGYESVIDNCGFIVALGSLRREQAQRLASLLGDISAESIMNLPPDQLLLGRPGAPVVTGQKIDYLGPLFRGRADPNPFYAHRQPRHGK